MKKIKLNSIIKIISIFAITVISSACITAPPMEKKIEVQSTLIIWEKRKPEDCGQDKSFSGFSGCAEYLSERTKDNNVCRIVMPEDSPDSIVAHEFKHCFGWDHKK